MAQESRDDTLSPDGRSPHAAPTSRPHPENDPSANHLYLEDATRFRQEQKGDLACEARYHDLLEILPETIYEIDLSGRVVFLNRAGFDKSGLTSDDLVRGFSFTEILVAEDRSRAAESMRCVLAGERSGPNEYTAVTKDGRTIPVLAHSRPVVRDGRVVGLQGILIDITERKQIEETLRTSEEKFSLAFHASPGGFAITSFNEGRYIEVNLSECLLNGYSREELIGKTIFELNIWADPQDGYRMRRLLEEHGVVRNFEYRFRKKSGEIRHGLVSASIINIRGERYILSEALDLTEFRKAEQALRKARDELDQRVKERTAELQRMTAELNEANIALRVLLRKCDQERRELEETVFYNAKQLILPYVKKLKRQNLSQSSRNIVTVIESKVKDLISPVGKTLGHSVAGLTPMEIRVADLIQQGASSKEIAVLLGLSPRTIETHRKNIRANLGISNKKRNLRSFLLSLDKSSNAMGSY